MDTIETPRADTETHAIVGILDAQVTLNQSVARALQAMALTGDRYDDELAKLNVRVSSIASLLERLYDRVDKLDDEGGSFSRRVS
jgi:hypothetical protein